VIGSFVDAGGGEMEVMCRREWICDDGYDVMDGSVPISRAQG